MTAVIDKLKKDERFIRFMKAVQGGRYTMDTAKIITELEAYQANRKIRSITSKQLMRASQKELLETLMENQTTRSRIVEIRMGCYSTCAAVQEQIDLLSNVLKTKYQKSLKAEYRNAGLQEAVVRRLLEDPVRMVKELEAIDWLCEMILEDVDKAYWTLKSVIDVLNMVQADRNQL